MKPSQIQLTNTSPELEWRGTPKDRFLPMVDGRDTPEFRRKFAEWLAEECRVREVRLCFDAEPDKKIEAHRTKEGAPISGRMRRKVVAVTKQEADIATREIDTTIPPSKREKITKKLQAKDDRIRKAYVSKLVAKLAPREIFEQVAYLNDHLTALAKKWRVPLVRKDGRPIRISTEEVAGDYDWERNRRELLEDGKRVAQGKKQTPSAYPDRALRQIHEAEDLGGEAARVFARPDIADESLSLCMIASALAAGSKDGRDCPLAETSPLERAALLSAFDQDREALKNSVTGWLLAHIRFIRGGSRQGLRGDVDQLASELRKNEEGLDVESIRELRKIHRAARKYPRLVDALRWFFFPGLTFDQLRNNRALVSKALKYTVEIDAGRIVCFLITGEQRKPSLLQRWFEIGKTNSKHRLRKALAIHHEGGVVARRIGKKDTEVISAVVERSGYEGKNAGRASELEAVRQVRKRMKVRMPK